MRTILPTPVLKQTERDTHHKDDEIKSGESVFEKTHRKTLDPYEQKKSTAKRETDGLQFQRTNPFIDYFFRQKEQSCQPV